MEIGFEHKLQDIKSELTELPIGVIVDKTEMFAVLTDGKVPVAKPKMLLIVELEVDKVI